MKLDLNLNDGKRGEWEFEYTASKLAEGAVEQKIFRLNRVNVWTEAKNKLMEEIRESGLEVTESMAAAMSSQYQFGNGGAGAPTIHVKQDLQKKLQECFTKIQDHSQAAAEYGGWYQVLSANPESRLKLTQADWLYFFGKN